MVQELVERYRQETAEAEAYEKALDGFHALCIELFTHPSTRESSYPSIVRETLEVDLVVGGEFFNIKLQSGMRGGAIPQIMAVVIKDDQGRMAPVFYLSRSLKAYNGGERKFSQYLEVCGISERSLREEHVWRLSASNYPSCKLRPPTLEDVRRYQKVLEEMREALGDSNMTDPG